MPQSKSQLAALVKVRGPSGFSEYEVLKIFCDVCESLARLHCCHAPVIYRDLRVENIIQNDMGKFMLAETPAATTRFLNPAAHGRKAVEEEIQRHSSLAYRAPEMVDLHSGHSITTKVDIWALGCVLYRLCYGATPFGESSKAIVNCQYNIPEKNRYSAELSQLVRFLLEADPEKRPNIYMVCEVAFKLFGKDNPLRVAREREKNAANAGPPSTGTPTATTDPPERKLSTSSIVSGTSVVPRSRPKPHQLPSTSLTLAPTPLNPSPKNVVSPVPPAVLENDPRFVVNFSEKFPTAPPAHSPAGELNGHSRNSGDSSFAFPNPAVVETTKQREKSANVSPAALLSPFEAEPPVAPARARPSVLATQPAHHILSNSNSEKSLVSPLSTTSTWNPFGEPSPFSPVSTLTEDQLFGAEFDKLRLEGSQTSIVTSPEEMKSDRSLTLWPQRATLTQALSTVTIATSGGASQEKDLLVDEDPFGSAPFTLPKRFKQKSSSSKLAAKLSDRWRHAVGSQGKESLIDPTQVEVVEAGGPVSELVDAVDKSSLIGGPKSLKLDDLISGGEKGSPSFIKLPIDDRNKYEKLNSNDITSDDSDSEFYTESLGSAGGGSGVLSAAGSVKKQSFKQFVENNIPEKLQAVYHKVDKGQIKNVQLVKKLRSKVVHKEDQRKVGAAGKQREKGALEEERSTRVRSSAKESDDDDDSIGSASDLRANDDFLEGDETDKVPVGGRPPKKFGRSFGGEGSVDDCISESIKTCGSSAYHAECESVTTNEDNASRVVTRVRVKKREHDSKHSVIDEDDSAEEDMIQGEKPLLLDDELDYESAAENNSSSEEVLMDPFTPEEEKKPVPVEPAEEEEPEIELDPFALAPFRKPAVPKRNSIKFTPDVQPIPENQPPVATTVSRLSDEFVTSTPLKPPAASQPPLAADIFQLEPTPPPPMPPPVLLEMVAPPEKPSTVCRDLFGSEPFPLTGVPTVEPPHSAVTIEPGIVALTHIIPNASMAIRALPPPQVGGHLPPPPNAFGAPLNARKSYVNFSQIPSQNINNISPDNNYIDFQPDDEDEDVRNLKSDDYDSSDTVVKSASKSAFSLGKKEKVKYNHLKEKSGSGGKEDGGGGGTITGSVPKLKANVSSYKKVVSGRIGGKKEESTVGPTAKDSGQKGSKANKKMGFSNMSFEDFPSDEGPDGPPVAANGSRLAACGNKLVKMAPFEVIRNEKMLLEAEKKFGSLKRRSNPFS